MADRTALSRLGRLLAFLRAAHMTWWARTTRDLFLIACGTCLLLTTPPSLQAAGITGFISSVWATMIGGGATLSLLGILIRRLRVEIFGCCFVGGGFLVWGFTSILRPDATLTSLALACVFWSGTSGQIYRVGMLTEGRVIR